MYNFLKASLKSQFLRLPRRLQHAYFGAFADKAPGGFARLIEVERLRQLFSFLDVDCVLDIGANEGQYALQLRRMVGYTGRIISFEPIPAVASKLREISSSDKDWIIEEIAVSNKDGFSQFNLMANSQLSSLSLPTCCDTNLLSEINKPSATVEVKCERLDSILDRLSGEFCFQRPFLKMDTQGYDLVIAREAERILLQFVGIQTELSIKRLYEDSDRIGEALAFFQRVGFELSAFVPNNQGHFPALIEVDGLFVRTDLAQS